MTPLSSGISLKMTLKNVIDYELAKVRERLLDRGLVNRIDR